MNQRNFSPHPLGFTESIVEMTEDRHMGQIGLGARPGSILNGDG